MEIGESPSSTQLDPKVKEVIDSRFNQTNGSKMAEIFTGFKPEDPKIFDKLIEIQEHIYQKYHLPDMALSFTNPNEFNQKLNQVIAENKIPFLKKTETKDFFEKYPEAYAAYFRDKKAIGINVDRQQDPDYDESKYYSIIMHETTHAIQDKRSPMSIEMMELEASIASSLLSPFKDLEKRKLIPADEIKNFFEGMYKSVEIWENQNNATNKPHYTAENLLKNLDGITDEQIETYKKQNTTNNPLPQQQ